MPMTKFVSVAKSLKMILIDLFKGKNAFGQWQNYKKNAFIYNKYYNTDNFIASSYLNVTFTTCYIIST